MCQKCVCGRSSAPDPARGAYSAPSDPIAGFKGPTSMGREGRGGEEKGRDGRERGNGRERLIPVLLFSHFEPWQHIQC